MSGIHAPSLLIRCSYMRLKWAIWAFMVFHCVMRKWGLHCVTEKNLWLKSVKWIMYWDTALFIEMG